MTKLISNNKILFRKLEDFDHNSRTSKTHLDVVYYKKKKLFNLASNDYLGLSKNKEIIDASINWTKRYGSSLSSSRLVTGNLDKINKIEKLISKSVKKDKSVIVGNGFLLNATLIPAITGNFLGKRTKFLIFSDKFNHASINYGCLATRQKCVRYNHLDLNNLEDNLKKSPKNSKKIIISETLFSMDGDVIDIDGIRFLSKKYNTILYLDEAHAMGVLGQNGFGLSSQSINNNNEIIVGTFSKGFGSYGSFVSCAEKYYKTIVNSCAGLVYSTVLPPSVLGAIDKSVRKMPKLINLRKNLKINYEFMLDKLKKLGFHTANSRSHIIPIILKDSKQNRELQKFLYDNGFYVKEIRTPTVPKGSERIRLSLTATMGLHLLKKFIKTISVFESK